MANRPADTAARCSADGAALTTYAAGVVDGTHRLSVKLGAAAARPLLERDITSEGGTGPSTSVATPVAGMVWTPAASLAAQKPASPHVATGPLHEVGGRATDAQALTTSVRPAVTVTVVVPAARVSPLHEGAAFVYHEHAAIKSRASMVWVHI